MKNDSYTFKINAFLPDSIPMARLAEYMAALAVVLGETERVHFDCIKKGSVKLLAHVENEASPKVRERLVKAQTSDGVPEAVKAIKHINDLLRQDNADGGLFRNKSNVLKFPGKNEVRPPKMGPFTQVVEREGVLVRVGGKDKSAHANIEDAEGLLWSFEVSRETAKELAHHLFGNPLRIIGTGRVTRDEEGVWQYAYLKANEFVMLRTDSLIEDVGRIRSQAKKTWDPQDNPVATILKHRGNKGVH